MNNKVSIFVLTSAGAELAKKIKAEFLGSLIHGKKDRVPDADVVFSDSRSQLQTLFNANHTIIGICASGILIRLIAPVIKDKHQDPPLIAVSEDGRHVVPLLGGHHGANELSRQIAQHLDSQAAITTSSDSRFCVSLDSPPDGWTLQNPEDFKAFIANALAGEAVSIDPALDWMSDNRFQHDANATLKCLASVYTDKGSDSRLVYTPKSIVVGVGCERHTTTEEIIELIQSVISQAELSDSAIAALVSVDLKMDEPAIIEAAAYFDLPLRFFDVKVLQDLTPRLSNPSEIVFQEIGCHGVAEAAALALAGEQSSLIVEKQKSKRATCAIAQAPVPVDIEACIHAQQRGHLYVVSLGPGSLQWRSPQATKALTQATDWVGYSYYLDLASDCHHGQIKHDFALGEEKKRVEKALELASEGKKTALICSGDAGIYAMGALVYECLDNIGADHHWQKPQVTMLPGISALQAAAAQSGAILGHDFAVISLSDLLTPWENIAKRIESAAQGDFVLAFYNPVSKRRTTQLAYAIDVLLKYRAGNTPVIIARQLGRDEENITLLSLDELEVEMIDMLTVVLIGSSTSKIIQMRSGKQWVYTPRGYDKKVD